MIWFELTNLIQYDRNKLGTNSNKSNSISPYSSDLIQLGLIRFTSNELDRIDESIILALTNIFVELNVVVVESIVRIILSRVIMLTAVVNHSSCWCWLNNWNLLRLWSNCFFDAARGRVKSKYFLCTTFITNMLKITLLITNCCWNNLIRFN